MKTLKNILTVVLFTAFLASCTPTQIDDDSPDLIEQATGGDDDTEIDDDKD